MQDVFISYSRSDKAFVQRLHESLRIAKKETWVDWQDIPLSANWWEEIREGIESANTFIIVVSPASIQSPVCNFEINYAAQSGKRIFPVLRAPVDESIIEAYFENLELNEAQMLILGERSMVEVARISWSYVSRHNWLDFTDDANFYDSVRLLIENIDKDLDYVQTHTRLLMRAHEWDANGRNDGRLLSGSETTEAEEWLTRTKPGVFPQPTVLHRAYINASRVRQQRRQRILLSSMTGAFLVMFVLAASSLLLFLQARSDRERADMNAEIAITQAAIADNQALVAMAAEATSQSNAQEASTQAARATVQQGIAENQAQTAVAAEATSQSNAQEAGTQAARATVQQGIAENQAQTAVAAEATSQQNAAIANIERDRSRAISLAVQAELALNDGRRDQALFLALAASDDLPFAWQVENVLSQTIMDTLTPDVSRTHSPADILHASYSPDGTRYVTADSDGVAFLWATDGSLQRRLGDHGGIMTAAVFSHSGTMIATSDSLGQVNIWQADSGNSVSQYNAGSRVNGIQWLPDDALLLVYTADGLLILVDASDATERERIEAHDAEILAVDVAPDGDSIASAARDGLVKIWSANLEEQRVFNEHLVNSNPELSVFFASALAFSPDGREIATAGSDRVVRIWDPQTATEKRALRGHLLSITELLWSPDGAYLVSVDNSLDDILRDDREQAASTAHVWDMATGQTQFIVFAHDGYVTDAVFAANGERLLTVGVDGFLKMWDVASGGLLLNLDSGGGLLRVGWDADRNQALITNQEGVIRRWDLWTSSEVLRAYVEDCCPPRLPTVEEARIFGLPLPVSAQPPAFIASCEGAPESRMYVGVLGRVDEEDPRLLNVRAAPSLSNANLQEQISTGQTFQVIDDTERDVPFCNDGFAWFPIRYGENGTTGWVAEGEISEDGTPIYYVEPIPPG